MVNLTVDAGTLALFIAVGVISTLVTLFLTRGASKSASKISTFKNENGKQIRSSGVMFCLLVIAALFFFCATDISRAMANFGFPVDPLAVVIVSVLFAAIPFLWILSKVI